MIAVSFAVFLAIALVMVVVPLVLCVRDLDGRVGVLEEARRTTYLQELKALKAGVEALPPRPVEDVQAPALADPVEALRDQTATKGPLTGGIVYPPKSPEPAESAICKASSEPVCVHPRCSCEAPCPASPYSKQQRRAR
jgi:hypothetical protein